MYHQAHAPKRGGKEVSAMMQTLTERYLSVPEEKVFDLLFSSELEKKLSPVQKMEILYESRGSWWLLHQVRKDRWMENLPRPCKDEEM